METSIFDMDEVSDNIEWFVSCSPDSPFYGNCQGKEAVNKCLQLISQICDEDKMEVGTSDFVALGNKVVVTGWEKIYFRVEEGINEHMQSYNCVWVFTLEDGIILKYEEITNVAVDGMFNYPNP
ncbi:hypothetical protein [Dapis sp. BLCC M229]|uniref:hypothetical protein n=1 Tax=Dapis sp. BLCC M229 TaxID=3400188 RepID=UPI003CF51051